VKRDKQGLALVLALALVLTLACLWKAK